jgi:murein DD-endopeptidase MepM/ murein hydrolase activator NlpD
VRSTGWLALVACVLLVGGSVWTWQRAEGSPPQLEAPESLLVGASGAELALELSDTGSGLRSLRVDLLDGDTETPLASEDFPGNLISGGVRNEHSVSLPLDPKRLRGVSADARVRVSVRDWSWRGGFGGNQTRRELPLRVDLDAPQIQVDSGLTYVRQGGSGAVAYRLSEPATRDGVAVGEHFYRGYPRPGGADNERSALFAIPSDSAPDVAVAIVAEDAAGNASRASWPVVVREYPMAESNVTLSRAFLERITPRFTDDGVPASGDLTKRFNEINTRVRAENEARIRSLLAQSSSEWSVDTKLEQLRNSKVTSHFGERRTYFFGGQKISRAVHYGYDLASFGAAPITAAAAGRVVYADALGIYGNCVLIDHGLGLATLYGHLSRLDVAAGDHVSQGQRLGLSGATGLAGGDHLHFAVLVGGTYVDPIEWWDARWVASHIDPRLLASNR